VLTWNGLEHLKYCIPNIIQCGYDNIEFYLIDNLSEDKSIEWVQSNYPEINIIRNSSNLGYAAGFNQGLEKIKYNEDAIIALANNDILIPEKWFHYPMELFDVDKSIGVIGFDIKTGNRNKFDLKLPDETKCRNVDSVSGCFYLLRANVFNKIGRFDETYYMYGEENDLFHRFKIAGFKLTQTNIPVWHFHEGSSSKRRFFTSYLAYRNRFFFCFSNLKLSSALHSIFGMIFIACSPYLPKTIKESPIVKRERPYNILCNLIMIAVAFLWNLLNVNKIFVKKKLNSRILNNFRTTI
jgi:GT2 family glycosyltransferase